MSNIQIVPIICSCVIVLILVIMIYSRFATYDYIMGHITEYVYEIAEKLTIKDYKKHKKQILTKQGDYTVAFTKSVQSKIIELNSSCQFYSQDFYYYYRNYRPLLKTKVMSLIKSYIKSHYGPSLDNNFNSISPEQFFKLKKTVDGDMVGVYVIYNKNKKMYYVGQATRLFFRVNQHFTGHGNGDVYGDYKRGGDKFTIKLLPLVNSGYYDLDKFEKDMIAKYDAYNNGYNKTIGNGN